MTPASLGGNAARWRVAHVLPSACVLDLVSSPGHSMSSHLAHPLARAAFSDLASHSPLPAAVAGADTSAEAGKRAAGAATWLAVFRGSDPAAGGAAGHGITHTTASMPYAWPEASCDAFPWNSRRRAQVSSLHDHRRMRPQHAEEKGRVLTGSKTAEESRPEGAICDALRQHKFHSHAHESVSRATCGHSSRHAHPCAITRISFSTHRRAREYATWQSRSEDGLVQARPSRHTNTRSRPSRSYSTSPRPVASSTSASSVWFLPIILFRRVFYYEVPALFSRRMIYPPPPALGGGVLWGWSPTFSLRRRRSRCEVSWVKVCPSAGEGSAF